MEPEPLELLGWAPPPVVGAAQAGPLGQPPVPLPAPALGGGHAAWATTLASTAPLLLQPLLLRLLMRPRLGLQLNHLHTRRLCPLLRR